MNFTFKNSIWLIIIVSFLILPLFTFGAFVCPEGMSVSDCQKQKLKEVYDKSYDTTAESVTSQTVSQKIGLIISYALAFLGVIFLVLVVYSGFQWMTAGGNEEKITQARARLINAVLGLAIILAAYSITWFVTNKLFTTFSITQEQETAEEGGAAECDPNDLIPAIVLDCANKVDCEEGQYIKCSADGKCICSDTE